ncbi:hypothetical protein V5799_008156 [Amblyomma americanum]|uniref:BTB domain-containing protein n=1 Tax=Amblyomma americanum TaxID=6943 RepID=A0AAQ4FE29_AMBAM
MSIEGVLKDLITKVTTGSFSTSFNALIEVSKHCRKDTATVSKFCSLGGISALLRLVEKPKYSDICLSILANCCLDDKAREQVIKYDGCRSIARILSCIEKESVRNRACRGLANIGMTSRGANEVYRCKGVEHIVTFLTSPISCEGQVTALRAVRILGNSPECRDELISYKAPAAAAKFLPTESLQKPALQALASLTQSCSLECALQVKDAEGFKSLVKLLQSSDVAVLESALAALVNLSVVGDMRADLGAAQVVAALVRLLGDYKLSKPSYGTVFSTLCRYSQDCINRFRIQDSGGLPLLVQILADKSKKELWSCAVRAILQYRYHAEGLAVLWSLDLAPVLLVHIRDYTETHKKDQHAVGKSELVSKTAASPDDTNASETLEDSDDGSDSGERRETILHGSSSEKTSSARKVGVMNKEQADATTGKSTSKHGAAVQIFVANIEDAESVDQEGKNEWDASETKSTVTDYNDIVEQGALNEDAGLELSSFQVAKNTFCIHSPSYREIQSQNFEPESEGCGDGGYQSMPVSPDQVKRPLSPMLGAHSPQSTDSGLWSPCSSPRCESPVNVSSPEPFCSFSPVCSESDSDTEQPVPSCIKNMVESVCQNIPKRTEFIKRKRSSVCEDQRKPSSGTATGSDARPLHSAKRRCHRRVLSESVGPVAYKDPQEMLLDGMLKILTFFTVQKTPEHKLGATGLFDGLMCYIQQVPNPLPRAGHIVKGITSDLHSFEDIVCKGEVLKLVESMMPCGLVGCEHCRQFRDLGKHWLSNLTCTAESGYGSGVLAHCLLTSGKELQNCCCLTIPHIVHDKSILRQLLLDCSALDVLLDLLEGYSNGAKEGGLRQVVDSLATLCTSISEKPSTCVAASQSTASAGNARCCLEAFTMDVQIQVDDGSIVRGNRLRLSEANDYFKAMLDGHFIEKNQKVVMFRSAHRKPLSIVIHFLHGCDFQTCVFMSSELSVSVQLDVLGLCDLMLLPNLQKETEIRAKQNLKLESICDVYSRALELGMVGFRKAALWFVLTEKLDSERRCKCLCELVAGKHGGQVLDDISSLVRQNLHDNTAAMP